MTFASPDWLWALALVPAFWWGASRHIRREQREAGGGDRARWLWVDGSRVRPAADRAGRRRYGAWASVGLALGIVALAQPQWGEGEVVRFDQGREVLIALDLSRSMLAEDVPPSRLGRARLLIESTLDELRGERVGLLLFAGTAFLQSPLSADHEVLRELLPVLEPGYLPQGGTDFASMIDAALEAFSQTGAADRFLVILSDGESPNFEPEAVDALVEADVRVVALGIGTEAGALIPDGRGGILKDDRGAAVLSRLERPVLEGLARGTNGVYADAAQWIDLASLVERTVAEGREGQFVEERERTRIHRFQWWLAPALALLLASHLFEVPATPRSRRLHERATAASNAGADVGAGLRAGAASLGAALLLFAAAVPAPAAPPPAPPAAEPAEDPILTLVEQLASSDEIAATDYAELARVTAKVGIERREGAPPLPPGSIRDALAAVEVGRALDADAAPWDDLRAALEQLQQQPPPPEGGQPQPGESDQSQQGEGEQGEQSGSEGGARGEQQQGQAGDPSEGGQPGQQATGDEGEPGEEEPAAGQPGSEAAADDRSQSGESGAQAGADGEPSADDGSSGSGEQPRSDPQAMADASAGFGELDAADGDSETSGEDAEAPGGRDAEEMGEGAPRSEPAPPSRMVGGTRSANEALVQSRPDLAAAVGRMERVREGDAPALLFDRMNRAEGRTPERGEQGGQDW